MSITQTDVTSFKAELLLGVHDFRASGDTFKVALYTSLASLDANTTAYTTSGEVVGAGYVAGGATLTNLGVTTSNTNSTAGVGFADFSDVSWPASTITARGALIYNTTPSATDNAGNVLVNPAVAILDFGYDQSTTATTFTIVFPTASGTTAIIRVS
jgi:hypothetical protein